MPVILQAELTLHVHLLLEAQVRRLAFMNALLWQVLAWKLS